MTLLGVLILAFLFIHLKDFWWQYKYSGSYQFEVDANRNRNIYALVAEQFSSTFSLVAYMTGLLALFFHLKHGFQSAFQTFGVRSQKIYAFHQSGGFGLLDRRAARIRLNACLAVFLQLVL
jgi:succinate dehydrogenase / fumarate reductase cytochrome b subunit